MLPKPLDQGIFISLEGSEGVGKSTQIQMLAGHYSLFISEVIITREPGGTPGAEAIRTLLMHGTDDKWTDASEALLFAAARADHVVRYIRPALARGALVLCDRYVDSTRAYQGGAGGLDDADIMALHRIGSGGLLPSRTLLLDMPPEIAQARATARDQHAQDRMGSKPGDYYNRVAARFRALAAAESDRFRMIDASGTPLEVNDHCIAALSDIAALARPAT